MPTEETMGAAYALPAEEFRRFFKVPKFDVSAYHQSSFDWQVRNAIAHVDHLDRLVPTRGTLFELGCSSGILLEIAQKRGWRTCGIDPSIVSSRGEDVDANLGIQRATLKEATLVPESFDVVFASSVVEHLVDPRKYLERIRTLLKPGGTMLVVGLPNVGSFTIRLGIDRYIGNHPPGHLQYFCRQTIARLLRECGFTIVQVRVYGMPETVLEWVFGKGSSGTEASPARLIGRPTLTSHLLGFTRRAMYVAFDKLNIGSVMEIVARRPQ